MDVSQGNSISFKLVPTQPQKQGLAWNFNKLSVKYSVDPEFVDNVQTKVLDPTLFIKNPEERFTIDGLISGLTYTFVVYCGMDDVSLVPLDPISVVIGTHLNSFLFTRCPPWTSFDRLYFYQTRPTFISIDF